MLGISKLLAGPTPQKLEQQGDAFMTTRRYSDALQRYEHAFSKLEKLAGGQKSELDRLAAKAQSARESLALSHRQTGLEYLDGGYGEEAHDFFALALELTESADLKQTLENDLQQLASNPNTASAGAWMHFDAREQDLEDITAEQSEHDYFDTLVGTLPEDIQAHYRHYGNEFQSGYVALNRGDFNTAADCLSRAMAQNPQPDSFIPLELASALVNLGRQGEAEELLVNFRHRHPEVLPAYALLCEIYWEQKDYQRVLALLTSVPEDLKASLAVVQMQGETLVRSGRYDAAKDHYRSFMDVYGWNETVAAKLAQVHVRLGEKETARRIYKEIMAQCSSCHGRIDPMVKHHYAELSFAAGIRDRQLLEMYLSLAQAYPRNASVYYERVSVIYRTLGDLHEAERFQAFALQAPPQGNKPLTP
jgi:tetratricopeptide (TPR) repeat protein